MPMHIWRIFSCFRMFSKALAWCLELFFESFGFSRMLGKVSRLNRVLYNSRQLETDARIKKKKDVNSNFAHPSAVDFTVGLQWETKSSESTWPYFSIIGGGSKNSGTPKWMVYNEKPFWNGWFGGTPIFGNIHMTFWHVVMRKLSFFYEGLGEAGQICDGNSTSTNNHHFERLLFFPVSQTEIIPRQDLTTNWLTATERSIFHWLPWTYGRYYTPWN